MHIAQMFLSAQAFAREAGISPSTVTKWLRSGKLKGHKEGSKWLISTDQLPGQAPSVPASQSSPPIGASKPVTKNTETADNTYSIDEFSVLTYLTVFGVQKWLKEGRLKGALDAAGHWHVDAENLHDPKFQRLIRK
jgi:excisionase family DNA binding protein